MQAKFENVLVFFLFLLFYSTYHDFSIMLVAVTCYILYVPLFASRLKRITPFLFMKEKWICAIASYGQFLTGNKKTRSAIKHFKKRLKVFRVTQWQAIQLFLYILALLRIIRCTQRGLENKLLDVVVTTKLKLAAVAMKSKKLDARKRGDKEENALQKDGFDETHGLMNKEWNSFYSFSISVKMFKCLWEEG